MKELSIEEKAKRYDKALERAKGVIEQNPLMEYLKKGIEYILPELKESEDEKTRKEIIIYLKSVISNKKFGDEIIESWIDWLEKQGKQPQGKSALEADKEVKVNNQNCVKPTDKVEPKFKVGQTIKKEGFNLGFTIVKIEDGFYYNNTGDHFPFTDQDSWELVEQNPAWSEDDEDRLNSCVDAINAVYKWDSMIAWLKSLKERYTWKPSDEQMEALRYVTNFDYGGHKATSVSLYEQLKKLKGE